MKLQIRYTLAGRKSPVVLLYMYIYVDLSDTFHGYVHVIATLPLSLANKLFTNTLVNEQTLNSDKVREMLKLKVLSHCNKVSVVLREINKTATQNRN